MKVANRILLVTMLFAAGAAKATAIESFSTSGSSFRLTEIDCEVALSQTIANLQSDCEPLQLETEPSVSNLMCTCERVSTNPTVWTCQYEFNWTCQ